MARLVLFAGAAMLAGAALGGMAGHATVTGMRADAVVTERLAGAYGVPVRDEPDMFRQVGDAWVEGLTGSDAPDDWDAGYRWAKDRSMRDAVACSVRTWSFQRGCEAATADSALS